MSKSLIEEIKVTGKDLVERIKEIVQEGNVPRVIIKNKKGKVLLEVPLNVGVAGLGAALYALGPFLPAIAFYALLSNDFNIVVERTDEPEPGSKEILAEAQIVEIVEDEGPAEDGEEGGGE